jgi:hypothetical protein
MAFIVVLGSERDRHLNDFDFKAAGRVAALETETNSNFAVVHSLHSLYSSYESISRQEFGAFAKNEIATHPSHLAVQALE